MGDKWSIQWTQSAAKNGVQYIVVSGNRLEAKNVARAESYTVTIVDKETGMSISGVGEDKVEFVVADGFILYRNETESISIYSVDGKAVRKAEGNKIEISGLPQGLYIIESYSKNGTSYNKIIIK